MTEELQSSRVQVKGECELLMFILSVLISVTDVMSLSCRSVMGRWLTPVALLMLLIGHICAGKMPDWLRVGVSRV